MKKEILKRLLAKPGEEHSVSEFDARYTGDLTKSEAEALLAENIGKLSSLQDKLYAQDRYAVLVIFQAMVVRYILLNSHRLKNSIMIIFGASTDACRREDASVYSIAHIMKMYWLQKCILKLFYPLSYRVLWDREILLRNFGKSVIVRLMITNAT